MTHVAIVSVVPNGVSSPESYQAFAKTLHDRFEHEGLTSTLVKSSDEAKKLLQSTGGVVVFLSVTQTGEAKTFLEEKYRKIKPLLFTGGSIYDVVVIPKMTPINALSKVIVALANSSTYT